MGWRDVFPVAYGARRRLCSQTGSGVPHHGFEYCDNFPVTQEGFKPNPHKIIISSYHF
jgi:hypothetical protein